MRLTMAIDALHRSIEEWTEEAFIDPQASETDVEAFREFGSELVAYLHEASEKMELTHRDVAIPENDFDRRALCDELTDLFVDEWAMIDFAEQPVGVRMEGLREVMDAVAEVLETAPEDCEMALEEATEQLDNYIMEVM